MLGEAEPALGQAGGPCAKGGSKEIHGVTGKFDLVVEKEARQRPREFCHENTLVIANTLLQQHKRLLCTWTSPDIRLIIFFAVEAEKLHTVSENKTRS